MNVYKWKPPERNVIDFLIVRAPKHILGVKPYENIPGKILHFLLCGIKETLRRSLGLEYFNGYIDVMNELHIDLRDSYSPIQFAPNNYPLAYLFYHEDTSLHGHVGEFTATIADGQLEWKLFKMRPDKDINVREGSNYGNDFKVARETFDQFFHPFTIDMLVKSPSRAQDQDSYFVTRKDDTYKPLTKFNGFVKAQLARQLERSNSVVDLCSGRGDLFTYSGFGIRNLLFVDKDADALVELTNRSYDLSNPKLYIYGKPPRHPPTIYTKEIDLHDNYKTVLHHLKDIPTMSSDVDGVIMNFAIHYLLTDIGDIRNLIQLINNLLKPGGIFVFTCFDGQRVFNLLKDIETDSSWDLTEDNLLKYSIKKLYQGDEFNHGQQISVIHPFSGGQYYTESLVDIHLIIDEFTKNGFEIRQNGSFLDWMNKFSAFNPRIAEKLTSGDIQYAGLYQYVSVWKSVKTLKPTRKKTTKGQAK